MRTAVVIPTYNRAALVAEAVRSAWAQTAPPVAVVVADDGSTDDTARAVADLARHAPAGTPLLYARQENARVSAARNTGYAALPPEAEAVLFLDDDDRLLPDALARLSAALSARPDAPLAYGRPRYVSHDGGPSDLRWSLEDYEGPVYDLLADRNFLCTPGCVLLRRAALEAVGPWDVELFSVEDWDMWLRLAEGDAPFARVADPELPVLEYRLSPNSLSHNHARLRAEEGKIYHKHRDRAPAGSPRRAAWETRLAARDALLAAAAREGASMEEALLTPRHRRLRRLLERTGVAALYRRVPLSARLRLRELLGVNRRA